MPPPQVTAVKLADTAAAFEREKMKGLRKQTNSWNYCGEQRVRLRQIHCKKHVRSLSSLDKKIITVKVHYVYKKWDAYSGGFDIWPQGWRGGVASSHPRRIFQNKRFACVRVSNIFPCGNTARWGENLRNQCFVHLYSIHSVSTCSLI